MRRVLKYCSMVLIQVLFLTCSDNRIAGTAGSETVNTFAVVDDQKKPVSGALLRLVAKDSSWLEKIANNADPRFFSITSGSDGIVRIPTDSLRELNVNICVDSGAISAFLPAYQLTKNSDARADTIILRRGAALSGSVAGSDAYPLRVMLQGTDYSADINQSTGEYSFTDVPAGDYHVIAMKDSARITGAGSVALAEGSAVSSTLEADFSGVLVDDFDVPANLMDYFKIGNWYIAHGRGITVNFPSSREKTDSTHIPYKDALVTSGSRKGKSLQVNYAVNDADYYLIVGAKVATRQAGFANIDTITFMARGSGILTVRLHGDENIDKPQALAYAYLDTAWQQFTFTTDMYEILDPANKAALWDDVKRRMTWLSFMPGSDGTEFCLDDVWLKGISMKNLIVP